MDTYRLITANTGVIDSLADRPAGGDGWRLIGDTDPDYNERGKAQIIDPEGRLVAEVEFSPRFRSEVMDHIRQHQASRQEPRARDISEDIRPRIDVTRIPTGQVLVTLWLPGGAHADEAIPIERGPNALRELWTVVQSLKARYPGATLCSDVEIVEPEGSVAPETAPAEPQRPEFVRCLACGTIHRAQWQGEEPDRLYRQCEACYEEEFSPFHPETDVEAPVVFNPRLAGSELKNEDPETTSLEPETQGTPTETESEDSKPPVPPSEPEAPGPQEEFRMIPLGAIGHFPGGNQRQVFNRIDELAESIRAVGIIQPLTVNEIGGQLTLIAGERRLRAAGTAGLTAVPCRVLHLTDEQAQEAMLIENIQREDLNPMEEAQAYKRLMAFEGATQAGVARRVGKSRPHVVEYLQLLELPADMAHQVATRTIAVKVALDFLRRTRNLPDIARDLVSKAVTEQKPSARDAGDVIDRALDSLHVARATPEPPATPTDMSEASSQSDPPSEPGPEPQGAVDTQPLTAPDGQTWLPGTIPEPAPATATETRMRSLRELGLAHWPAANDGVDAQIDREAMLTIPQVLENWKARLAVKAARIPRAPGHVEIHIPEHQVWIRGRDMTEVKVAAAYRPEELPIVIAGTVLAVRCNGGLVHCTYVGNPVYYRVALYTTGSHRFMHQQLVIQDGGRHLVVSGIDTLNMQADQVPDLDAILQQLPALA